MAPVTLLTKALSWTCVDVALPCRLKLSGVCTRLRLLHTRPAASMACGEREAIQYQRTDYGQANGAKGASRQLQDLGASISIRNCRPICSHSVPLLVNAGQERHLHSDLIIAKPSKQHRIPASYYRGGTSRAPIFLQKDLPEDRNDWAPIFRAVIGSPDPNGRQIDGLGGGMSSLSKICVVGPPTHPRADVDFTFVQIGVKTDEVDYSGNCGNMTAAIGPFAVDSGMVTTKGDCEVTIVINNTNTHKLIEATFPVFANEASANGTFAIDGVAGTSSRIQLSFLDPAGSKTGSFLPTGRAVDLFDGVETTCIDAGNPCCFVTAESMRVPGTILPDAVDAHPDLLARLDSIRRQASVSMGVSRDLASTPGAIPKISIVSAPMTHALLSGEEMMGEEVDVVVRAISGGNPHRAVPMTVALSLAAAARVEGSVVAPVLGQKGVDENGLTVGHASGKTLVAASFGGEGVLEKATVFRTARKLMSGWVYWS